MYSKIISKVVDELSDEHSFRFLFHKHRDGGPLPSQYELERIVELCRSIIFPGYYGNPTMNSDLLPYHIGMYVEKLFDILRQQIHAGLCFVCDCEIDESEHHSWTTQRRQAAKITSEFIEWLPELRRLLSTDVEAMYNGDPAACNYGEVISCYPSIKAVGNYRIAHKLLELGVPLIPRIITEIAHSETGIDIHPGAKIGEYFTIDHGTGVVIGETCIIGNHVKLYQGVTLGAKNFPVDENGNPIKGNLRHPVLEDNVVVYANATILGRITVGRDAVIGGNVWVTKSVPAGAVILQTHS